MNRKQPPPYPVGELRITSELLEITLNASSLGMTVVKSVRNASGQIIDFEYKWLNTVATRLAGESVVGKRMLDIYPHVKTLGLFDAYVELVENKTRLDFEEYYPTSERWFRWSGNKVDDGLFIIVEDITERKQAEQELVRMQNELAKKATDLYHTLFNSIDEGFCVMEVIFDERGTAVDLRCLEVNAAFARHTGIADAAGKTANEIIPGLEPFWFETYAAVLHTGKPARFEGYLQGLDHWFDVYASRIGLEENRQVAVVFNDITQRKKLEQQRDDFISIASHELRTPVTSIKAYAEIIEDMLEEAGDTTHAALMHKLNSQVNKLAALIHALLDTTKVSQGHLLLHLESFHLDEMIDECVEILQRTWPTHRMAVHHAANHPVTADREMINQVLTNLVSNAIKYSSAGSEVAIRSKQVSGGVQVSVQDGGIGIPEDAVEKVFDRFFRVNNPSHTASQGMGLGLYITAGIIHRHGGTIWAESRLGKGSVFHFILPAVAPEA